MTVSEKIARLLEMEAAAQREFGTSNSRVHYLNWALAMQDAGRPLLLALQALLVERSARESILLVGYANARKSTDAALKELEDAAQ